MIQFLLRRTLAAIPAVLGVMIVVFFVVHLIPGDPIAAMLGDRATGEQLEQARRDYGLDRPLHQQFLSFVAQYGQGDLGESIRSRRPVMSEIAARLPHTGALALGGVLIGTLLGVPFGVAAAMRRGGVIDLLCLAVTTLGMAAPIFWIGLLLVMVFSINLGWFPSIGAGQAGNTWSNLHALVLPAASLGLASMALIARMTRSSMLEVLKDDYVRTAHAKGLHQRVVVAKHALRNAANPIITIVGLNFGQLLGGTVLIETVFARPGLGKFLVDGILARDYPVVQGVTFVIAISFILVNIVTDLLYGLLDPRVRMS